MSTLVAAFVNPMTSKALKLVKDTNKEDNPLTWNSAVKYLFADDTDTDDQPTSNDYVTPIVKIPTHDGFEYVIGGNTNHIIDGYAFTPKKMFKSEEAFLDDVASTLKAYTDYINGHVYHVELVDMNENEVVASTNGMCYGLYKNDQETFKELTLNSARQMIDDECCSFDNSGEWFEVKLEVKEAWEELEQIK